MQKPIITQLPKSQVELKFVVTVDEAKPYLDQAVTEISEHKPLKGFRPGKATYEDIKRAYGEMLIWETAIERIVRAQYVKTILEEKIETVGSPEIAIETLVPGQDIAFTLTASVMPQVTQVIDYEKPLVEQKRKEITEATVDAALEDLRKMRRVEVVTDRAATKEDMALIDLEIFKDKVLVEGGSSRDYRVYLNEDHYIPEFADKLVGAKKGDVKTFDLEFPKDHYNKQLAGHPVTFTATIKDIYELQLPKLDDEFAKTLGIESFEKLRELLKSNLEKEEEQRSLEAAEIELLEKMTKGSRFTDIPELLITEEVRRMMHELERSVEEQNMKMEDYLSSLKKTKDDLRLDFIPRAIERIQTSALIREIGRKENVEVSDAEIEFEQDQILARLPEDDKKNREMVVTPDYREYVGVQIRNRKILNILKKKGIKGLKEAPTEEKA